MAASEVLGNEGDTMIVAYSYVPVLEPEAGGEFERAMRGRSRAVDGFPGFKRFEFRKELGRSARYVIVTWWESRDDLKRYLASDAHKMTHTRLSDAGRAGLGAPTVVVHEVMDVASS